MSDAEGQPAMPAEPAFREAGQPCSEARFYALACNPGRSVAVEACAGAGKTWMLVSRMVRALLDGAQPHEILAITFTRKAAGEMRQRLERDLATWATATPEARVRELCLRGMDRPQAEAQQAALGALHERLAASGREVAISTFHSWFAQLMLQAPVDVLAQMGLAPGVQTVEDTEPWMPMLLRRLHRWIRQDPHRAADHRLLLRRHGASRVAAWMRQMLAHRVEVEMADQSGVLEKSIPGAAACWPECADVPDPAALIMRTDRHDSIVAVIEPLRRHKDKSQRDLAEDLASALDRPGWAERFDAVWAALYTQDDEPRAVATKGPAKPLVAMLEQLHGWRTQQWAHEDQLALSRLSRGLFEQWQLLKRELDLADMVDLERVAHRLLSDDVLAGWVQQRLDQRWRHLLIDEFQDTSTLQWQALAAWLSGYAGAGGGASGQRPLSLFVVGDPKQSIYRFRRAEPRVFAAAAAFVVEGLDGVLLQCDHTRRNAPAVLELVNTVFDAAQASGQWGGFRGHTTSEKDVLGGVRLLERLPRAPRALRAPKQPVADMVWRDSLRVARRPDKLPAGQAEAEAVAVALHALVQEQSLPLGEVLVLSRKRERLALVAQALRRRGIPCVASEKLRMADLPEAADLLCLLDALASPANDLALAQALRSPAFDIGDGDLLALAGRATRGAWVDALLQWDDAPADLARARDLLRAWQEPSRRLPPHDLLDRIVSDSDFVAHALARAQPHRRELALRAVQALLWQALDSNGGRFSSPYALVRAMRAESTRLPVPAQPDAVRLMTIHGAKGLEARAVFLVDADPAAPRQALTSILLDWPVAQPHPTALAFVASPRSRPPSLAALAAEEQHIAQRERLNLLYVALTRARQWLVVSATEPQARESGPNWWSLMEPACTPWQPDEPQASRAAGATLQVPVEPRWRPGGSADRGAPGQAAGRPGDATGWRLPTLDAAGPPTAAPAESARLGTALHRVLEWALQPGADQATDALSDMATAAVRQEGLPPSASPGIAALARRLLDAPALRPWLDPSLAAWSGNEVPVVVDGQWLRIDRLVCLQRGGRPQWWVLDYKMSAEPQHDPALRDQLHRYRAAVQALQPGDEVRAAFITGRAELVELAAATAGSHPGAANGM